MNMLLKIKQKGFTLIELLVVISIIAVILGLVMPNLMGVRGRARDVKMKNDMQEVRNALRMYYNDFQSYPAASGVQIASDKCDSTDFSMMLNGVCTVYMKKLPLQMSQGMMSYYVSGDNDFCLAAAVENQGDSDIDQSQSRCTTACAGHTMGGGLKLYNMCD
jgi:type II secretion system protein G